MSIKPLTAFAFSFLPLCKHAVSTAALKSLLNCFENTSTSVKILAEVPYLE